MTAADPRTLELAAQEARAAGCILRGTPVRIVDEPKHMLALFAGREGTFVRAHPRLPDSSILCLVSGRFQTQHLVANDDFEVTG